ncbi:MAG TPA: hypothetical protein VN520_29955 [Streptomyces sp.]|uniref:hypothetical protein n=1 Tax=Streptomyces sp. TaxID=1931 RepID=UPI002D07B901|nr:hypothetical protein [Streptomyces sp.]HWU10539.1 hypothetical protein [Streptomyces sp.]
MPRNQNTAAQRARRAQTESGGKYTALLREAEAGGPPKTFPFRSLMAECATRPEIRVDWGYDPEFDWWPGPAMFDSVLLGGPVPCGTVLALAGALSSLELRGDLHVETYHRLESALVSCEGRRFQLILNQDLLYELCRTPGCSHRPVNDWAIPYCVDHLCERRPDELITMASEWGHAQYEEYNDSPGDAQAGKEGDLLVKAATGIGACTEVTAALLKGCFTDPQDIEDTYGVTEESIAIRHGLAYERLRLAGMADEERARIRLSVDASCTACSGPLSVRNPRSVPPQYCSTTCAPPPPEEAQHPNPWVTEPTF